MQDSILFYKFGCFKPPRILTRQSQKEFEYPKTPRRKVQISSRDLKSQGFGYYYSRDGSLVNNQFPYQRQNRLSRERINLNSSQRVNRYSKQCLSRQVSQRKGYLQRMIFVVLDGQVIDNLNELKGFIWNLSGKLFQITQTQDILQQAILSFKVNDLKIIFNQNGQAIKRVEQITDSNSVIFVGRDIQFQGCQLINQGQIFLQQLQDLANLNFRKQRQVLSAPRFRYLLDPKPKQKPQRRSRQFLKIFKKSDPYYQAGVLSEKLDENIYRINLYYPHLDNNQIKLLQLKYKFGRSELHRLYAKYKCMLLIAVVKNPYYNIKEGINKQTFIEGVTKGTMQGVQLVTRVFESIDFNHNGYLEWEEFLQAIDILEHGTQDQKISMFFNTYDTDGNGFLSFDETQQICRLQIQQNAEPELVEELSYSYAQFIFRMCKIEDLNQYLSIEQLKDAIKDSNSEKGLIEMFYTFECLQQFMSDVDQMIELFAN